MVEFSEGRSGWDGVFMDTKEMVYQKLNELGIDFETTEHAPVFTIEEMAQLPGIKIEDVCKNLFLRDDSGKRHFLVILREDKTANLQAIRGQIGSSRLGFASEDRLQKYLGLTKGSVTPFGLLNDKSHAVEVLIDSDLRDRQRLGFHPNENTATVWMRFEDLEKFLTASGTDRSYVEV